MSESQILQLFEGLFDASTRFATAPLMALATGVLLLLVAEVVDALRPLRAAIFLGALFTAGLCEARILQHPEVGLVAKDTLACTHGTALWGLLFVLGTALAWAYSHGYYADGDGRFKDEHDVLMLSAPLGMMLMAGAENLVVFFVGLELLSIPLYVLAAFRRNRAASVEAGLKYFLLGSFASALFVYGASLLYTATGEVSLEALRATGAGTPLAVAGVALLAASLFFKLSVFPFHLWVPDVYQGSPTPVTALMAAGTKGAALAFLINATFLLPADSAAAVGAIALVTMAVGNLGALVQDDLKRMLAYSGIAHAGTLLLVVAAAAGGGADGALRAALFYTGAYLFTITGAFGLIALLEADGEHFTKLEALRGLSRSRPGVAAALALFMLSLGGIPATGGFLGKWFVFAELVEAEMYVTAALGVLLSVVALGYYLRVIVALYMEPEPEGQAPPTTTRPLSAGLATAACCAGVLAMGVVPGWFLELL